MAPQSISASELLVYLLGGKLKPPNPLLHVKTLPLDLPLQDLQLHRLSVSRTKLAALYSATKSLQNGCTAKLQLFSSVLEAKQQLNSSCSGMQKRCAAFEALGSGFAAQLPTFKSCEVAAVTLQFSCAQSDSTTFLR